MTQVQPRPGFDDEVRADVRYEKGLLAKAGVAVVLVLIVIGLRLLFLS
jgi:hypothetical protein